MLYVICKHILGNDNKKSTTFILTLVTNILPTPRMFRITHALVSKELYTSWNSSEMLFNFRNMILLQLYKDGKTMIQHTLLTCVYLCSFRLFPAKMYAGPGVRPVLSASL